MPTTQINQVSSTVVFQSSGPDGSTITVKNLGPDSCYYATAATVSSGSNDGTLTSGSTISFFPTKNFISAGTSRLQVTTPLPGEQLLQYDRDNAQAGQEIGVGATSVTFVANRGFLRRFVLSRTMTITKVAFALSTASSVDDPVDVGIYSAALDRLASSGATLGLLNGALGTKAPSLTSPITLRPGVVYYAALSWGTLGGSAAVVGADVKIALGSTQLFGATAGLFEWDVKAAVHPLPPAWGALGSASVTVPHLAVRET